MAAIDNGAEDGARRGRPQSAEDLLEIWQIHDVMHEYCDAVDEARLEDLVQIFTTDCRYDLGFGKILNGRNELTDFLVGRLRRYSSTTHHVSNIRVRMGQDRSQARATSYVYARSQYVDTEFSSELWGRYLDDLVRVGDRWLIAARQLRAAASARFPAPAGQAAAFEMIDRKTIEP